MKFFRIDKPQNGQRWVIGDIHGCCKTFRYLVENEIQLTKNDQLFLLGDYINRGPDSAGVIRFVFELQKQDFQVFPLRGNHEQMLLDSHHRKEDLIGIPRLLKGNGVSSSDGKIFPEFVEFFNNLPFYFETEGFYLVHAGFNFKIENPLEDFENMLWIRDVEADIVKINRKKVVHGHTVVHLAEIQEAIQQQKSIIPLDNGCYYGVKNPVDIYMGVMGNLCAFNLDTWELKIQVCID